MTYQQNHRRAEKPQGGISLFPFLAVLLCTMGALIVLLMLIARQSQLQVPARPHPQPEEIAVHAPEEPMPRIIPEDQIRAARTALADSLRRVEALEARRDENRSLLDNAQQRIALQQQHSQQTEEEIRRLAEALESMKALENTESTQQLKMDIAETELEIEKLEAEIRVAESNAKHPDGSYAVIPYDGPGGTRRYPFYMECRDDGVYLMPENIHLTRRDFEGVLSRGNPLEAMLSAKRQYLLADKTFHATETGLQEPYPLMIVRPGGIIFMYMAQEALRGWNTAYGYELIDDAMRVAYPPIDEAMKRQMLAALQSSREYQSELALSAPSISGLSGGTYSGGGGAVAYRPSGGGTVPMPVDNDSRLGRTLRNSGRRAGGAEAGGMDNAGNVQIADVNTLLLADNPGNPGGGSSLSNGENGFQASTGGGSAQSLTLDMGGTNPSVDGYELYFPDGNDSSPNESLPGTAARNALVSGQTGNASMANSTEGPTEVSADEPYDFEKVFQENIRRTREEVAALSPDVGNPAREREEFNQWKKINDAERAARMRAGPSIWKNLDDVALDAVGEVAVGVATEAVSDAASKGIDKLNGTPSDPPPCPTTQKRLDAIERHEKAQRRMNDSYYESLANGYSADSAPGASALGTGQANMGDRQTISETKGMNWALEDHHTTQVPLARPIRVLCYSEGYVLPATADVPQIVIHHTTPYRDMTSLAREVGRHVKSWGAPGQGMYWRPKLIVSVASDGGQQRLADMNAMLRNSGLEVEEVRPETP